MQPMLKPGTAKSCKSREAGGERGGGGRRKSMGKGRGGKRQERGQRRETLTQDIPYSNSIYSPTLAS